MIELGVWIIAGVQILILFFRILYRNEKRTIRELEENLKLHVDQAKRFSKDRDEAYIELGQLKHEIAEMLKGFEVKEKEKGD